MKSRLFSIISILALMLALSLTAAAQKTKSKQPTQPNQKNPPQPTMKVELQCEDPGTHQDAVKTPFVTNTTKQAIKKGTRIFWTATVGNQSSVIDKGQRDLDEDLAAGAVIHMQGSHPGNNYDCKAWYLPYAKILK